MCNPWRCVQCGWLVYAVDYRGLPSIKGAPNPHDMKAGPTCEVCFDLWMNVSRSDYWRKVQVDWEGSLRRAREKD